MPDVDESYDISHAAIADILLELKVDVQNTLQMSVQIQLVIFY